MFRMDAGSTAVPLPRKGQPVNDLTWVQRIDIVEEGDDAALAAYEDNPGWHLLYLAGDDPIRFVFGWGDRPMAVEYLPLVVALRRALLPNSPSYWAVVAELDRAFPNYAWHDALDGTATST